MKKTLLTSLFAAVGLGTSAQSSLPPVSLAGRPKCLFNEAVQKVGVQYTQLAEFYQQNAVPASAAQKGTGVVYDIPVVFHVVYGPGQNAFNIPDSVLVNQLQILNKAFRKQHTDTGKTRGIFKPLSSDAEIQFHLATVSPTGSTTTGITRTASSRAYFGSSFGDLDSLERVKSTAAGGIDPWPANRYFNIWVCNMTDGAGQLSVLGYGLPPLNPMPPNWPAGTAGQLSGLKDGVVIQVHAVGSNNPIGSPVQAYYTKGRALVHEVGHYLGLQHVFGGGDGATSFCGTPTQSDGIGDTPEQSMMSFTPGSSPSITKNSCGSGANDTLDMWENYMDYTVDSFQTLFTTQQIAIIRGVLANQRLELTSPTSVGNISQLPASAIYPNPAYSFIQISYGEQVEKISVFNFFGQKVMALQTADAAAKRVDVSSLAPGNYLLVVEDANGARKTGKFTVAGK